MTLSSLVEKTKYAASFLGRWTERRVPMNIVAERPMRETLCCTLPTCACRINNFIWVSEKLRLVYFETPKCGCSSIKHALNIEIGRSQFATAFLIQSGRSTGTDSNLLSLRRDLGSVEMSFHQFDRETLLAATRLMREPLLSGRSGKFEFRQFYGRPEQAVASFPDFRKFVVLRDPFERLQSAWSMFYNSSGARLRQRLSQTEHGLAESRDIRRLIDDMAVAPNHHFEPLTRFVPLELLESEQVEAVALPQLRAFWSELGLKGCAGTLPHLNKGKGMYPRQGAFVSIEKEPSLLDYYAQDWAYYRQLVEVDIVGGGTVA